MYVRANRHRESPRPGWVLLSFVFAAVLPVSWGMAQLTTGTISGTVVDQSGGVVPGAEVTVTHIETQVVRTTLTDDQGRYQTSNLPVGEYSVTASQSGFQTSRREGINLSVGRRAVVDFTLKIGEVNDVVTVTGDPSLLETSTATVSNLVDEREVLDLPLNNRDLTQLTFLQPGVIKVPSRARQGVFSGMGDKLSVAGARQTHNIYLLDGVSNSDLSGNAQGASGAYIGAETVKEFQIITNNYSAEYESKAGGIISAVTKSGTNDYHGSVFWFLRNDNLDATNFFDNSFGNPKPEFKRNQFGFSAGGPLAKDRTFWFTSYEGLRERLGTPDTVDVPLREASDPNTVIFKDKGKSITAIPKVVPYLNLYPIPTPGSLIKDFGDGTVRIAGNRQQPTDDDFVSVKIDHEFGTGAAGSLSGSYNYNHGTREPCGILCDVAEGLNQGFESTKHTVSIRHTSLISSTLLNEFAFGFSFSDPEGQIPLSKKDLSGLAFIPGKQRMGQIDWRSRRPDQLGFRVEDISYGQRTWTFKDGLSMTRGNHSLKFGATYTYADYDQFFLGRGTNGIYRFRDLDDFLVGKVDRFDAQLPGGNDPERNFTQSLFGAYFQDDWKVTPSFTLNLGLRYEFATVPNERDGKVSNLVGLLDTQITTGVFYTNATKRSFSPRVGFAWALGQNTTLRGGGGIFYVHPVYYHFRTAVQELPPFTLLGRVRRKDVKNGGVNFPDAFTTQQDLMKARPNIRPMQFNQETTYMYRWSLTLQHAIGNDWVLTAGYTGSRGLHLWNQNLLGLNRWVGFDLTKAPTGRKRWPFTLDSDGEVDKTGDKINDEFSDIRMQLANGNSYYHGLTLGAQKRFGKGLSAQLSYSLSKAIDQGSGVTSGGDQLPQSQRGIFGFDMREKRGLSSHHIANYFSANFTYELPKATYLTGFAGGLVNGWQINSIITLTDGYPLSVLDPSDLQTDIIGDEEGLRVNLVPGGDNNPVLGGPDLYYDPTQFLPSELGFFGTLGRNTLIGPGLATVDFSLFKNINFGEHRRLQFRAEFFNLFNRANFGEPDLTPFQSDTADANGLGFDGIIKRDPNAGVITRTVSKNREIQFGLKFIF